MKNKKELVKKCKKRSYTSTHSKDIIDLAVDAIKMKRLSSYEAEKVFGIPRRTLLDKVHNKHPKRPGCPAKLSDEEEANIVKVLIAAANYGSPLTLLDLRIVVYRYLEGNGRLSIFDNKLPGKKWAYLFVKRNKSKLSYRVIQNIKRSRAEKSPNEMNEYFANLRSSLEGVPIENILNYDETNLSDNPGVQKCLFRRGVKYPERVLNHTKGSTSIMFAITAGGECLPPYVVYKAEHLYTQWTLNGPKGARFNRSKSGWFDSNLFEDWFETIILPWAKNKPGKKVIIGDNLASHISYKIVTYCEENDICFVFLPPNSSHITQPLDVCYFGPLKKLWREILTQYKMKNPREATIHKGHFPDLLKKLLEKLNGKTNNIISGFKSTGIAPFNPDKVISKLPGSDQSEMTYTIDNALLDWLKETRSADPCKKVRCKKLNVPPGKSICSSDVEHLLTQRKEKKKRQKKNNSGTPQMDSDSLLQSSLVRKNPDSLKKMCIGKVNAYLSSIVQNAEESSSHILKIQSLGELSRNDEANVSFIGNIPECLQTNKPKIKINSNVIFKADSSLNIQQKKQGKTNSKQDRTKIVRSALHMKLVPIKQEKIAEEKKILQEITQETDVEMTETVDRKPQNQVKKRKINNTETNKAKKKMQKHKSKIRTNRRSRSSSSLSNDFDLSLADTEDSEYETMEDFINYYQNEEQENIEPPYGISDIEYSTDHNKLKEDSWILAQFVTKKSKKHYVGKIISIKDNVPEVKFVRKVKNSKFNKGTVFTYPAVEDICNVTHSDDVVMVLPEPKISRRGQIIFNMNFRKYNIQ